MKSTKESASIGVAPCSTGTDISCRYFWEVGLPAIEAQFPSHIDRIAAGSAAIPGSRPQRALSFPGFRVFLTDSDFAEIGAQMECVIRSLPSDFCGLHRDSARATDNVLSVKKFFTEKTSMGTFSGFSSAPEKAVDWLRLPEDSLFDLTQVQVFYDPLEKFSRRRQSFAAYYPVDVWRKRTALALRECGESGQLLLRDALSNGDFFTAQIAWWKFSEAVMKLGFLLNRRYAPQREMLYREFCRLPELAFDVINWLWDGQCDTAHRMSLVDLIASSCEAKLLDLGESRPSGGCADSFLFHGDTVSAAISDPEVRTFQI